jgi:hypothetical protein
MDADEIAFAKGAEVYKFDFAHADVADTFSFSAGRWAPYQADATVVVGDDITPQLDANGQSVIGNIKFSVPLAHLTQYASAHVEWVGSGIQVIYSLDNGATWTAIDDMGAIALDPATNPDLDFLVGFDSGLTDSFLGSFTVSVLKTDTLTSTMQAHSATFSADVLTGDSIVLTSGKLDLAPDPHDTPVSYGSIEMNASFGTAGRLVDNADFHVDRTSTGLSFTGCSVYADGVAVTTLSVIDNQPHHIVITFAPTNTATRIAQALDASASMDLTLTHLALYPNTLSVTDVASLFAAQSALPKLSVTDDSTIAVTESTPAVDIYAYTWSIVSASPA